MPIPSTPPAPAHGTLPELATFLCERRERITSLWIEAVRRNPRIQAVDSLSYQQLADHLPALFDDLADLLRGELATGRVTRDARSHGEHRWQQDYSLAELVQELGVVSGMVLEHGLDAFEDAHPEAPRGELRRARQRILHFFERTAAGSIKQYVEKQHQERDGLHERLLTADRASAAAAETERDRLEDLFRRSPAFLAVLTGPEHVFTLANELYLALVGGRDILHKPVREALPEVVAQGFVGLLDQVYRTGEPFVDHEVRVWLDNTPGQPPVERFIDLVYQPTRAPDGAITGVFVHGVDLTWRKLAQRELERVSEQRRLALDSARMGWWDYDLTNDEVHWDERFQAIFGFAQEVLPYEQVIARVHPEDRRRLDDLVQASIRPRDPVPCVIEYRVVHDDGSIHWVSAQGQAAFEGEGAARRAVRLVGTLTDVTREKLAADGLRASEEKYRSLFESIDTGFCVIEMLRDAQGNAVDYRFEEVNPAFEAHTGLYEAGGKTIREMQPGIEQVWVDRYERVARTGIAARFMEGSDVLARWFDVYAFALGDGETRRVAILFSDISERRRSEQALQAATAEAEAASRAKDDFLAALSHELRTPLTPVLMAAEDLCEDPVLPPPARETLRMMHRNITLEARLIDDLLDLTRIAKGKLELRVQDCEAHSLAGLALEIVRDEAQAKGITLDVQFAALRTCFRGDPARVQQVFWNLFKNAVKFTPPGGRVAVRTRDEGLGLVIEVSDTGVGLAPEYLERIFNPFEQAGLINNARFGGLGLGLAIAKAIVDLHGGTIRAASPGPGRGATFRVELAAVERRLGIAEEEEGPGQAAPPPDPSARPPAVRPLRLLLVEDHEATLNVITRLLAREGHVVRTAASVAGAREIAEREPFDLVISDIGLPDGTGIDLMQGLHARYGLRGIALTGYGMEDDLHRSREAGFVEHLVKPVDFAQLRRALIRLAPVAYSGSQNG